MVTLEVVKSLIDIQAKAYNGIFDSILKQFLDKVAQVENIVTDLKRSLEFSQAEVDELKAEVKKLREGKRVSDAEVGETERKLRECANAAEVTAAHCNALDDHLRRHNLLVDGLPEDGEETSEATTLKVIGLLAKKLDLPNVALETAYRVGPRREDRPRTILTRFKQLGDRDAVMRNTRKLQGTKIYLNDDLCPGSQKLKASKMPELRAARSEGKRAFFVGAKLVIRPNTRPSVSHRSPGAERQAWDAPDIMPKSSDEPKNTNVGDSGIISNTPSNIANISGATTVQGNETNNSSKRLLRSASAL